MLSFIQQEYLERVIAQSPKVAQDREVIELAVSKVRGHLKENHSDLWHKFLEYEVKRESGSAVYPSAMLILRDHDISRTIMNREYDSGECSLSPSALALEALLFVLYVLTFYRSSVLTSEFLHLLLFHEWRLTTYRPLGPSTTSNIFRSSARRPAQKPLRPIPIEAQTMASNP